MNSSNNFEFKANSDSFFTPKQLTWLAGRNIPKRVFVTTAAEFDDKVIDTSTNRWCYRASGRSVVIDFDNGRNFALLSPSLKKLIQYSTLQYMYTNTASKLDDYASALAKSLMDLECLTHDSIITHLKWLATQSHLTGEFFYTLFMLRNLDTDDFFLGAPKSSTDDLETQLLGVPRPANTDWGVYADLNNVLPEEVRLMLENGLARWAGKLTPTLKTMEEKRAHLAKIEKLVNLEKLQDCIVTGLLYITGARPVQISNLAVGDVKVDTQSALGSRFSLLVPYAKKAEDQGVRIRVALPDELGRLILLYIRLTGKKIGEPLLPQAEKTTIFVNECVARFLLLLSPKEIKESVANNEMKLPVYTATLFRHNVGHTMAMNGSSAEEIADILGHADTAVANRYIEATPELADIREQALGRNPVFKNMVAMMLTGNIVHSSKWSGKRVAGEVGGKLHTFVGGCAYKEAMCPFAQVRACYGCLYFKPFSDGNHIAVFDSFSDELEILIDLTADTHEIHHPLMPELLRRRKHVKYLITRIAITSQVKEEQNATAN